MQYFTQCYIRKLLLPIAWPSPKLGHVGDIVSLYYCFTQIRNQNAQTT